MDATEILKSVEEIEAETGIKVFHNAETGQNAAEGRSDAVNRGLEKIRALGLPLEEITVALCHRQGLPAPDQKVEIRSFAAKTMPSIEIQRENHEAWRAGQGPYFKRSKEELDRMFASAQAGDEIISNFAHSIDVRRPDGRIFRVNLKGEIVPTK